MSGSTNPNWGAVEQIIKLFYPQYFDPADPAYVDPDILAQLDIIAMEARPWCVPENAQNLAEAMYLAYLISLRSESSSGQVAMPVAGPIVSEKEGDIQISYAAPSSSSQSNMSQRPSSDPWDAWNKLWMRCASGAILTRYGDPCRNGLSFTAMAYPRAMGVWNSCL